MWEILRSLGQPLRLKEELNLKMVDHNSKADFNGMSVAEFKKYQQEQEISASGYL